MTKYLGIIGYPLGHSVSPAFQQAALDHCGIDARYLAWATPPDEIRQRMETLRIPADFDYDAEARQLSTEARQKLARVQPLTLGQASRISGVSPADVSVLMVLIHARRAAS